jgi:hypothetical protein
MKLIEPGMLSTAACNRTALSWLDDDTDGGAKAHADDRSEARITKVFIVAGLGRETASRAMLLLRSVLEGIKIVGTSRSS